MAKREIIMTKSKILKSGILIGIKESYLFVRNLYGIYSHPFLTTKRIIEGKSYFQGILLFGLPIYLWLAWVFVLLLSRIFIRPEAGQVFGQLQFGILAKSSFLLVSLFVSLLSLFLGYWFFVVWQKKERKG